MLETKLAYNNAYIYNLRPTESLVSLSSSRCITHTRHRMANIESSEV